MRLILLIILAFFAGAAFPQLNFNFEDGSLNGWVQEPAGCWEASSSLPLAGAYSLRHSAEGAGMSVIATQLPPWEGNDGTTTWSLKLRHGYNPSSFNRWAVVLSGSEPAIAMADPDLDYNGYAMGVNQTGSDDTLKLYRVTGGQFTHIHATGINWELDIKPGGVGVIQVERSSAGELSVRASTTGAREDMQPHGAVTDTLHPLGSYLGIIYQYTSMAAQRLWVDNISVTYTPNNTNDHNATVSGSDQQPPHGEIPSLAHDATSAVDVLRFSVCDQGGTDGLPTLPTLLRFVRNRTVDTTDWTTAIAGVRLSHPNGDPIPIAAAYIHNDAIEVEVEEGSISVADGSCTELSLAIYLKSAGVRDGSTIALVVPQNNHGWRAHHTGSTFAAAFADSVVSSFFTVRVVPTHLYFSLYPQQVVLNGTFNVAAYAADSLGNQSASFDADVSIALNQGEGSLLPSQNITTKAQEGVATWSGLSYSGSSPFSLSANSSGLAAAQGAPIAVINDTTSIVVLPAEPIQGASISSLSTSPGAAVEVMRLAIADMGGNDGLATEVSQLQLIRPEGDSLASYSRNIAGVLVWSNGRLIPTGSADLSASSLAIPIPKGALIVPDGEQVEVTIGVYLKSSGLEDGRLLRFHIPRHNHGFEAYPSGSGFALNLNDSISSSSFSIDVKATHMAIRDVPRSVAPGQLFSVDVNAVDANGNIDVNAQGGATIARGRGEGWLTVPQPTVPFTAGVASWSGLAYHTPEPFTLVVSSNDYAHVASGLIYCADATTMVRPASDMDDASLISSLAVSPADAVEAISFWLADEGDTDGQPTYVQELTLHCFGGNQNINLNQLLAGVVVAANGQPIQPSDVSIAKDALRITFAKGTLTVPNADSLKVSVAVYLRKGSIAAGSSVRLYIPPAGHGLKAYDGGSYFAHQLTALVIGSSLTVDVAATELRFVGMPLAVSPTTPFSLSVAATDRHGSIDTSVVGSVELALEVGPRAFIAPTRVVNFIKGRAEWNPVQVGGVGEYTFRATPSLSGISSTLSGIIWCGFSPQCHLDEDFEGGYPLQFPYSTTWGVSTVNPVSGEKSLKHALSGVAGESSLPIPLDSGCMSGGFTGWEFSMRNGSWSPSAGNAFWFVLASDTSTISLGNFNGYAVGVNLAGSTSNLTLWRVTRGEGAQAIIQTEYAWEAGQSVSIRVTRTPRGEWDIWLKPHQQGAVYLHYGSAVDTRFSGLEACGPAFRYTSTRAGELWVDDIKVCKTLYPPVISNARCLSLSSILVEFNQPVEADDATDPSMYRVVTLLGQSIGVDAAFQDYNHPQRVTLRTQMLPLEPLQLLVSGVRNAQGLACNDSIQLGLGAEGEFGNVIINELMVRPSPPQGLPQREYIELHNRTDGKVALNGWRLRANDRYFTIPDTAIRPNGFILLCGASAVAELSHYGEAVAVTSFPSLLNAGMLIAIYNGSNQLVSWVEYSDSWYADSYRSSGGYSLERIDPSNLVEGQGNWRASNDPSGGTPGRENSLLALNPDVTPPRVVELKVLNPNQLEVGYSESMDSLSITLHSHYTISATGKHPTWVTSTGPRYNRATLTLEDPLPADQILTLCFNSHIVDFAGNPLTDDCLPLALPSAPQENDIVVNEVLFNPYPGGIEFVELYNRSARTFDLSQLWVANRDLTTHEVKDRYVASDTARFLFPGAKAVLTADPALVTPFYYVPNPELLVHTPKMPSYRNDMGYVLIIGEDDLVIDEFAYNERMHIPVLSDVKGVSLERIHPDLPSGSASSWQSAAQSVGFATPTYRNSQYQDLAYSSPHDEFSLSKRVFSPYTEGSGSMLLIDYHLPHEGYVASIIVFDTRGRPIRRLANSKTLATSGVIKWDGLTDQGRKAPIGAYVVFIEVFDLRGYVKRYKLTCAVAARF